MFLNSEIVFYYAPLSAKATKIIYNASLGQNLLETGKLSMFQVKIGRKNLSQQSKYLTLAFGFLVVKIVYYLSD